MKHFFYLIFLFFSAFSEAQQTEYVDFKTAKVNLDKFNIDEESVEGKVIYIFDILKETDSIFIDAKKMEFENVSLTKLKTHVDTEYTNVVFANNLKQFVIHNIFKKDERYELKFDYSAKPKKAIYFVGWQDEAPNQIWTQGQGKYTSNWLPSIDDTNDKIEFDLSITFENDYEVIANGKLVNKEVGETTTKWSYDMQQPMSSYLVALAIGKYNKKVEYSKSGIPLEMYYYSKDSSKVEPTYRYTKQMFDFLEEEIGVRYPWQDYKQVPVHDFLYAGMENTSCTIFSDAFLIDEIAFVDKNYVNVNAHELAHQWFGDLVTSKSGEHHWLQEGFATYYALLAEREVYGDDYYYWRLYEYAQELLKQEIEGNGTSLLNPKSSSTTFYKKGAWVLHVLREKVGDEAFKKAVKSYLGSHQFKNVETNDLINEVENASGNDLNDFESNWLKSAVFPKEEAFKSLSKNEFAKSLIELSTRDKSIDVTDLLSKCDDVLHSDSYYPLQQELMFQLNNNQSKRAIQLYKRALNSNDIKKRQAVAQFLTEISSELKQDYESLLQDKSYITIESALYNLWNNFPEDRVTYLNQTKDIIGFNTKNVHLLWLVLAISTPDYQPEQSKEFYDELVDYTSLKYNFELRQSAFQYLLMIKSCKTKCLENLEQATTHHNWRLSKFAREQLKLINTN